MKLIQKVNFSMTICRFLGNACIEIISDSDHIIIDPVFLTPPQKGIEKVFITHHHSDHINLDKFAEIRLQYSKEGKELEVYGPKCLQDEFEIELTLIEPDLKINLNHGTVEVFENNCWKAEDCVAFFITIGGKKLLHTADSANFSEQLRSIKDEIDICFVACFESNFYDYLEFLNIIKPKMTIPYHFTAEKERDARKLVDFLSNNNFNSRFLEIGEEFEF